MREEIEIPEDGDPDDWDDDGGPLDLDDADHYCAWLANQPDEFIQCPNCHAEKSVKYTLRSPRLIEVRCTSGRGCEVAHFWSRDPRFPRTAVRFLTLPRIEVGTTQFALVGPALSALGDAEYGAPETFRRGDELVTVADNGTVATLTTLALRRRLAEAAVWVQADERKSELERRHIDPPATLAAAVLRSASNAPFPFLDRVVTVPVLDSNGALQSTEGYGPRHSHVLPTASGASEPEAA